MHCAVDAKNPKWCQYFYLGKYTYVRKRRISKRPVCSTNDEWGVRLVSCNPATPHLKVCSGGEKCVGFYSFSRLGYHIYLQRRSVYLRTYTYKDVSCRYNPSFDFKKFPFSHSTRLQLYSIGKNTKSLMIKLIISTYICT